MEVIAGRDPLDSTSDSCEVPVYREAADRDVRDMVIGKPREYFPDELDPRVARACDRALDRLVDAGATVKDISLPHTSLAIPVYYIIAPAEASSNLARYDGVRFGLRVPGDSLDDMYEQTRAAGFGKEVRRRVMIGTYVLSAGYYDAYYLRAQRIRALILKDFTDAFKDVDVVLTPSTPSAAFGLEEKFDDPVAMYLNDVFTVTVNLAGLPAISVPAGLDNRGLPLGLQLIGRAFDEETVLRAGRAIERAANFTAMPAGF
jgi:aspartyl-tRNA(Asn)/glutamyl-tRNA(Gln) amidotransferase subunit A